MDQGMKKAVLAIMKCGTLSTIEIGRIVSPVERPTEKQAFEYGQAMRSRLLQAGLIDPSPHGNREFRYGLNRIGRAEAFKLMEIA